MRSRTGTKGGYVCDFCDEMSDLVWRSVVVGQRFRTPDLHQGRWFRIGEKTPERLTVLPQRVSVSKTAFAAAIHFLLTHRHGAKAPCEIRSSNDRAVAGPLCLAARNGNGDVRCINYILPILQHHAVVGINPQRPNTVWLIEAGQRKRKRAEGR